MQAHAQFLSTQRIAQSQIDVLTRQLREEHGSSQIHNKLRSDIISLQQELAEVHCHVAALFRKLLSLTELVTSLELESQQTAPAEPTTRLGTDNAQSAWTAVTHAPDATTQH